MDLLRMQLWKAVKTLPWYVGVPAVLVGAVIGGISLMVAEPPNYHYEHEILIVKVAAGCGFILWVLRQAVRLLWTVRLITKQPTSVQILPPQ